MRLLLTADPELPVPPPLYGGIERIVASLCIGLRQSGHVVGLVANKESTAKVDALFSWTGSNSGSKVGSLANSRCLARAVQAFQPDVVHSFSRVLYLLPLLANRLPKIMSYQRKPSRRTVSVGTHLARGSLTFTGCSEHISSQIRSAGGEAETIYNFVDTNKYQFRSSVPDDAPLVFLSRIESIKGTHTAIKIAKSTGRRLVIAGNHADDGPAGLYWQQEIAPHIGVDGIEYVGPVNDLQKNELLGSAAAMIVPIQWDEPFGIVFVEALACGTPVISAPLGALPEIIQDGENGFLARDIKEARNAVEKLHTISRERCRAIAVTRFSMQGVVDEYLKLYRLRSESNKARVKAKAFAA